ncbi:NUDIX domain-containing protein [Candidatus Curtissbacteria bacterium]|nr:NUDIX domain-containing protein [Candidatus Curtissbacteria bacterium]
MKRLSEKEFLKTFKKVPRVSINLLIIDDKRQVLLTKRNIPPFKGFWHFPGSFIQKNERITDCQKRVARDELGLELDKKPELSLLGAFDDLDGDPRGHTVDLLYAVKINDSSRIKTTKQTSEVKFFKKLPKKIGFNHRITLEKLGFK